MNSSFDHFARTVRFWSSPFPLYPVTDDLDRAEEGAFDAGRKLRDGFRAIDAAVDTQDGFRQMLVDSVHMGDIA